MWFGIGFTCHPGNAQVYRKSFSSFSVPQGSNQPSFFWEAPGLAEALFALAVTQNYYWPQGDIDCILGDFFGFVFPTSYARQIQIAEGGVLKMQGIGKVCSEVFVWEDMQALESSAAAAAKSLQSCPTLCDPIDGSPPGSPVPGILQARTLEWVAISFSNAWKWKVKVKLLSCVRL